MEVVTDEHDEQDSTCPAKAAASAWFLQGMEKKWPCMASPSNIFGVAGNPDS